VRAAALACLLLTACDDGGVTPECFEGTPLAIAVEVDPAISPPADPVFDCSPEGAAEFCVAQPSVSAQVADLIAIRVVNVGFVGWWPWIGATEVARDSACTATPTSGTPAAATRRCARPKARFVSRVCPAPTTSSQGPRSTST
jgi:hypothetical protein